MVVIVSKKYLKGQLMIVINSQNHLHHAVAEAPFLE